MDTRVKPVKVVFVDLDNTLYDWLGFFGPAFRGLCTRLSELSGQPMKQLYEEFKCVFAKHGSVEYSFALQELPSLRNLHPSWRSVDLVNHYFEAIQVYQSRRRRYLRVYHDVSKTVQELQSFGLIVVAISDSHRFQVLNRLRQLHLLELLDGVCCIEDHVGPSEDELDSIRKFEPSRYQLSSKREFLLPHGLRKPSPGVLHWLLQQLQLNHEEALYVGDSLIKDIAMAREAGIYDCWAAYGNIYSPLDMSTLVQVTHWPAKTVEKVLNAKPDELGIQPSCVIHSFMEVLAVAMKTPLERRRYKFEQPHFSQDFDFELSPEGVTDGGNNYGAQN